MRAGVCVRGVGGFVLMGKAEAGGGNTYAQDATVGLSM